MQWMLDINHSMQWLGYSLSDFFISEEQIKQSAQPPTLVITTDQEGTQLAATNFLRWHLNACIEHTYDPQHRRSNDTTLALGQAGVLKQACHAVGLYNLQYGPWQKGGFHEQVVDAATEMKEGMNPNDDLLKLFFDDILLDLGESRFLCSLRFVLLCFNWHAPVHGSNNSQAAASHACMLQQLAFQISCFSFSCFFML